MDLLVDLHSCKERKHLEASLNNYKMANGNLENKLQEEKLSNVLMLRELRKVELEVVKMQTEIMPLKKATKQIMGSWAWKSHPAQRVKLKWRRVLNLPCWVLWWMVLLLMAVLGQWVSKAHACFATDSLRRGLFMSKARDAHIYSR